MTTKYALAACLMVASTLLDGTTPLLAFDASAAQVLQTTQLSAEQWRAIAAQRTLIVYVGNGEARGTLRFTNKVGAEDRRSIEQKAREFDYDTYAGMLQGVSDLRTALCKPPTLGIDTVRGEICLLSIVDGPANNDSQILTTRYAADDGAWKESDVQHWTWREGEGLKASTASTTFELNLPKSLSALVAKAATLSSGGFRDTVYFSQIVYLFRSHGSKLTLDPTRRPSLFDRSVPVDARHAFLFDSHGQDGEILSSDAYGGYWTEPTAKRLIANHARRPTANAIRMARRAAETEHLSESPSHFDAGDDFAAGNDFESGDTFEAEDSFDTEDTFESDNTFENGNTFEEESTFEEGSTFETGDTFEEGDTFSDDTTFEDCDTFESDDTFGGDVDTLDEGSTFEDESTFEAEDTFEVDSTFEDDSTFEEESTFEDGDTFEDDSTFEDGDTFEDESTFEDGDTFEEESTFEDGGSFGSKGKKLLFSRRMQPLGSALPDGPEWFVMIGEAAVYGKGTVPGGMHRLSLPVGSDQEAPTLIVLESCHGTEDISDAIASHSAHVVAIFSPGQLLRNIIRYDLLGSLDLPSLACIFAWADHPESDSSLEVASGARQIANHLSGEGLDTRLATDGTQPRKDPRRKLAIRVASPKCDGAVAPCSEFAPVANPREALELLRDADGVPMGLNR